MWVLGAEVQTLDTRTSGMSAVVFANYISSFIIGGSAARGAQGGSFLLQAPSLSLL